MTLNKILSFHNDPKIKEECVHVAQKMHLEGWFQITSLREYGMGVAHAVTDSFNKSDFEKMYGLPIWLAHLEEDINDNIGNNFGTDYPVNLIKTIPVGVNKEQFQSVYHKYCIHVLENVCKGTQDNKAISNMILLHKKEEKDEQVWKDAQKECLQTSHIAKKGSALSLSAKAASFPQLPIEEIGGENLSNYAVRSITAPESPGGYFGNSDDFYPLYQKLINLLENCMDKESQNYSTVSDK